MISILFTILKIIGIAILVILGLVLLILLLVLFVPVRYSGKGSYQDDSYAAKLHASWLLHIISVRGEYQKGQALHMYLKIFGITFYDNLKADGRKSKHKKTKSTKNKTEGAGEIQAASAGEQSPEEAVPEDTVPKINQRDDDFTDYKISEYADLENRITTEDDFPYKTDGHAERKIGIIQKIKNFFINFVQFLKNITFTFHKVCDTMVRIKNNIEYYLRILQLDSTKRAFAVAKKQLTRVLGKISPRKYRINLHLGFDDPAVMGEVLAVWGMCYPLHQGNIDIQPEFEQSVIEGDISFRGAVNLFVFVRAVCILFFDKDIKHLIKHLKRSEI